MFPAIVIMKNWTLNLHRKPSRVEGKGKFSFHCTNKELELFIYVRVSAFASNKENGGRERSAIFCKRKLVHVFG